MSTLDIGRPQRARKQLLHPFIAAQVMLDVRTLELSITPLRAREDRHWIAR